MDPIESNERERATTGHVILIGLGLITLLVLAGVSLTVLALTTPMHP